MKYLFTLTAIVLTVACFGQNPEGEDSVKTLGAVIIKGFESQRNLFTTPATVGLIRQAELARYTSHNVLPAVNTVPGVRMEERSPGSYRLNIRGSLLRSPFGIRNIKVYWNDMSFTDAGGNTYLNLIDPSALGSLEVLKGPGGSLYGANTGGVVVMHSADRPRTNGNHFKAQLNAGSFETLGEQLNWQYHKDGFVSSLTQGHQQADGYRENSRMRRDVVQWNGRASIHAKGRLEWMAMYADLYYQTPGGLNEMQMNQNPRQARQATAVLPGAVEQKAAIYNKTIFTGLSYSHSYHSKLTHTTSVVYSFTDFKNPFITNYEKRKENNFSVRSKLVYATNINEQDIRLIGGVEWQGGKASIDNYGNRAGKQDTVQSRDRMQVRQWFPFVQGEWQLRKKLLIQLGASTNAFQYRYRQLTGNDPSRKTKKFDEQFLPRLAVLYPFQQVSLFASVSKGFSPATLAEIRASDANINTSLQPEFGWNYELGTRIQTANKMLEFDITAYIFKLEQAIVRRNNASGEEYFVNAGGTDQKGLEVRAAWTMIDKPSGLVSLLRLWSGFTFNDYQFTDYVIGNTDHSNNRLTGVPRQIIVSGIDVHSSKGLYLLLSHNHTGRLPLNDANSFYADAYDLVQGKLGWKKRVSASLALEIFAGIDNALNERYSLGNDINAVGNRFFNPAATRNYFGGITLEF